MCNYKLQLQTWSQFTALQTAIARWTMEKFSWTIITLAPWWKGLKFSSSSLLEDWQWSFLSYSFRFIFWLAFFYFSCYILSRLFFSGRILFLLINQLIANLPIFSLEFSSMFVTKVASCTEMHWSPKIMRRTTEI